MGTFALPKTDNLELFDIEFDNSNGVVYAGEELKGRVMVMFGELVTLLSARLRIIGRARTAWSDDQFYKIPVGERTMEHKMCEADELFFDKTFQLYGSTTNVLGKDVRSFRRRNGCPGTYEMPFKFEIPPECPSTFEGEHGYIRYICCVSVSTPDKSDRQAKRPFTVIQPCDLNSFCLGDIGSVAEPVNNEMSVNLNSGCFLTRKVNEISILAALPKTGFVCGERIPIWANVANNSGQKIKKVKATLLQRVRYLSNYRGSVPRERLAYRSVAQVSTKEELGARWALIWDQESILIPPLPPTIEGMSDLIQIDYGLVFEAASLSVALPIYIGTIPLKSAAEPLRNSCSINVLNLALGRYPANLLPLPPCWKLYDEILTPPCYCKDEDSGSVTVRERADTEYAPGQLEYQPRYPYYGWPYEDVNLEDEVDNVSVSVFQ